MKPSVTLEELDAAPSLPEPEAPVDRPGWRRLVPPIGLYLLARAIGVAGAWVAHYLNPTKSFGRAIASWDSGWYIHVAEQGYPTVLPAASGNAGQTPLGFFPGFPLLIRGAIRLTGIDPRLAGIVICLAGGAVATVLLWLLTERLCDAGTANRAVALFVFAPSAFVLNMVYSEGVFLAAATACIYLLLRRAWLLAGLAGAVASAVRPTGLVVVLCCGVAALLAIRDRREWKAFVAPVLGSSGFLAFALYLEVHTGSAMAFARAQAGGWGQGFDFGRNTVSRLADVARHPLADLNLLVCAASIVFVVTVALVWLRSNWRPPVILYVYTAGILFPAVMSSVLTSTARFTMTAFPLFIALGRRVQGEAFYGLLAASAAAMAILMVLAGFGPGYTP